tara:strand:- start:161 stop:373 length:213 start_codon:yes stop_codon:yes gene_type:complete
MMEKAIGSLIVAVAFIAYAIYCVIKGGTHHRDVGWATKEERPKSFIFSVGLYFLIGVVSIIYYFYQNFVR